VRGRVDFGACNRNGGNLAKLVCESWERLPHTRLNRFLAAALRHVERDPVFRAACSDRLAKVAGAFAGIAPYVDPDLLSGQRVVDRMAAVFEPACALARVVLSGSTLGERGSDAGSGFLVNLEMLFERAVIRSLRHCGIHVVAKHPVKLFRTSADGGASPQSFELDAWCPFTPGGPVIVDAKFKLRVSAANIQQLIAYCFLTGARRAAFVLPSPNAVDARPIVARAPSGERIEMHILGLQTTGTTVEAWSSAATMFGDAFDVAFGAERLGGAVGVRPGLLSCHAQLRATTTHP
jgi:hypothetical protein